MSTLADLPSLASLAEFVVQSYRDFLTGESDEDPKAFAARHVACKAALAHLDLLLRLARAHAQTGPMIDGHAALISDARHAVRAFDDIATVIEDTQADDDGNGCT